MNILSCVLDANKYNWVSGYKIAKGMWKIFKVTHEGINQMMESKLAMLARDYELFAMKPNESIVDMFNRCTNIMNGLKSYGKKYNFGEQNMKISDALPKSSN